MATVKGTWTFKDVLSKDNFPNELQPVNFTSNSINFTGIEVCYNEAAPVYALCYYNDGGEVYPHNGVYFFSSFEHDGVQYEEGWDVTPDIEAYKTIDFGETGQPVSNEFYAWLIKNTLPIKINVTENGTKTLHTAGKYCDRNIDVNVDVADSHYDTFWDVFQEGGNRTGYSYGFSGVGWNDTIFKPKYDIIAADADTMFRHSHIADLKACLENSGVTIDFSRCTKASQTFGWCYWLSAVPKVDLSSSSTATSTFVDCVALKTIEEFVVGANTTFNLTFRNCHELENLTMTGTIGQNGFDVQHSTKLSKTSIESIINALSSTTSGLTVTISKTAKEAAFTDDEWATLIATKSNWTISLV